LLALLSLLSRVVLVADDLEGFSADETAGLRLAAFLGSLRQSAERLDVILSLNRDVWNSAFVPRLSSGLIDRLSEVMIELEPLTEADMVAVLDSRTPNLGSRLLEYMRADGLEPYARGLLRAAGAAWLRGLRESPAPEAPSSPAAAPDPPATMMAAATCEPAPGPLAKADEKVPATTPPELPSSAGRQPSPAFPSAETESPANDDLAVPLPKMGPPPLPSPPTCPERTAAPQLATPATASESSQTPPDLENPAVAPPTSPVPPPANEVAQSPLPAPAEVPAWEPPDLSAAPAKASPFIVPATPAPPPVGGHTPSPFRTPAESPTEKPSGVSDTPPQPSPFSVPPFIGETTQESTAAWHEITGPTAPFDIPPEPTAQEQASPEPPAHSTPSAEELPPIDHDRVEDLLRKFRERYSRPNP
jgi:hypothetical protein